MAGAVLAAGLALSGCAELGVIATQPPDLQLDDIHDLGATRVAFDPSGGRIATGGHLGEIYIWQVPDGTKLLRLKHHEGRVRGFIWIDAMTLVSASQDGSVVVWDLSDASKKKVVDTAPVSAMDYIAGNRSIVTGHEDGMVRLWRYPHLTPVSGHRMDGGVRSVAVSHDEQRIAVSSDRAEVQILDSKLRLVRNLPSAGKTAQELRFSPDDRELAAGTWFDLYFWNLETGRLRVEETEHLGAIISIDYTPDGSRLVSLGRHTDSKLRLRNLRTNRLERRLRPHNLCGYLVRISPDGRYVASASEDASVRLYDISKPYEPSWGR